MERALRLSVRAWSTGLWSGQGGAVTTKSQILPRFHSKRAAWTAVNIRLTNQPNTPNGAFWVQLAPYSSGGANSDPNTNPNLLPTLALPPAVVVVGTLGVDDLLHDDALVGPHLLNGGDGVGVVGGLDIRSERVQVKLRLVEVTPAPQNFCCTSAVILRGAPASLRCTRCSGAASGRALSSVHGLRCVRM